MGFDGVFIDQISSPQLTTIRQPLALIAKNLVKEIVNRVESDEENTKIEVNITPELIIRDSTQ
ncbi:substrate-binding domain-containing protein [Leuconostoc mesenteroides]|uniref:substrate-binding domain-containing protein n=1 Tax=Leuconostoc mesenteroides TaxID=1245 RepID=UPI0030811E68